MAQPPSIDALLGKAFDSDEARLATAAIHRVRSTAVSPLRSYELVRVPGQSLEDLAQAATPKLIYHLESLGVRAPEYAGIFLSLFSGDRVYFIQMKEAVRIFAEALGRAIPELVDEYGTHEQRTAVGREEAPTSVGTRPTLLLPAPPSAIDKAR